MSEISKLPFHLRNLSKELNVPSVNFSGWPPRIESNEVSPATNVNSIRVFNDKNEYYPKRLTSKNDESYFEKLRSVSDDRRNDKQTSYLIKTNDSTSPENQLNDILENLIESIQPCNDIKNKKSKTDRLLSQFDFLKQMSRNNTQQYFNTDTFTFITSDGNVIFDFSKQSIDSNIYIQLMQLVRLSNLDKIIEKTLHKSGEYHHIDYKEKRRNQLNKDQENLSNTDNCYITMAKAVHFRALSHCFVLDGIDISSRFHYDQNILRDTCLRFHNRAEMNQQILVLCTNKMKQIYRLLESLLKSYISPYISIIYITIEEIELFLSKYQQMSCEKDLFPQVELTEENIKTSTSDENLSSDNDQYLLTSFRTSSLVLILMKHLDETLLTTFIQWYIEDCLDSDLTSIDNLNKYFEHFWLITNDYQHAERILNILKTNLFLWPTEHNEFDHISIIISSILSLPIALSINYENYSMFINGISIIDKHCQETSIDQNVCIYMALLRIWLNICEKETIGIITYDNELEYFSEYAQLLLDGNYQSKIISTYTFLHGRSLTNLLNNFSYDLITINRPLEKISHPYSFILLDKFTPVTFGILIGVYQLSIFFEKIIRDQKNSRQN